MNNVGKGELISSQLVVLLSVKKHWKKKRSLAIDLQVSPHKKCRILLQHEMSLYSVFDYTKYLKSFKFQSFSAQKRHFTKLLFKRIVNNADFDPSSNFSSLINSYVYCYNKLYDLLRICWFRFLYCVICNLASSKLKDTFLRKLLYLWK